MFNNLSQDVIAISKEALVNHVTIVGNAAVKTIMKADTVIFALMGILVLIVNVSILGRQISGRRWIGAYSRYINNSDGWNTIISNIERRSFFEHRTNSNLFTYW